MDKNIFFLTLVLFSGLALAQPTPPHEVYGTVQYTGEFDELTVEALNNREELSLVTPDEQGYYSIKIPLSYETAEIGLETGKKHEIDLSSASVTELHLEASSQSEQDAASFSASSGSSSGGSSGGSGGGGLLPGQEEQDQQDREQVPEPRSVSANVSGDRAQARVGRVEANQTVEVAIPDQASRNAVESVSFRAASGSDSVDVVVRELREKPRDVGDAGASVYRYQEINVSGVADQEISSTDITFRVNKSFLDSQERTVEEVVLKRFNDESWEELPTRFREETGNAYRFVANSGGFSYYAIALRDQQSDQPDEQQDAGNETGMNETGEIEQPEQEGIPPWILGLLLIIAGLAIHFRDELTDFVVDQMPVDESTGAKDESEEEPERESDDEEDSEQEED